MAAKTGTYSLINSTTLGSAQSSVTFSSIPATFTDLVLVVNSATGVNDIDLYIDVNSDTATNYSWTRIYGTGSAAASTRGTNSNYYRVGNMSGSNVGQNNAIIHFFDYSNTTTFKTVLSRSNNAANLVEAYVSIWRSTSAISSINTKTQSGNFLSGSIFKLYGIEAGNL